MSCDYNEFYDERRVRARKQHKCCETRRVIEKGEYYWRCSGKTDGEMWSVAQSEAAYWFARWCNGYNVDGSRHNDHRDYDECLAFGEIRYHIREVDDPALTAEWERVCAGEVTRGPNGTMERANQEAQP